LKIAVFGLGYVGAVSCGCLASLGHEVIGVDVTDHKIDAINAGRTPILEPGLAELVAEAVAEGRLRATRDVETSVRDTDAALICVGTPSSPTGGVLTTYLENVCREIGEAIRERDRRYTVIVRSTSLPHVHAHLIDILERTSGHRVGGERLGYVCHPEFLREGSAVADFYEPPEIVYGTDDARSREVCGALYPGVTAPTFFVSTGAAAMVKYAANAFHAVKVTFANEIGTMCRHHGVDAGEVMDIFCRDTKLNVSARYLRPGTPFGGSCLPKDLRALLDAAREVAADLPMLDGTLDSNRIQIETLVSRLAARPRVSVGIVGLAFKEGTDDVRESPAVAVVERLLGKGHSLKIYDRYLSFQSLTGSNLSFALQSIPHLAELLVDDVTEVVDSADVVLVNHKLTDADWSRVQWRPGQRILDVAGVPALRDVAGYEGLYWRANAPARTPHPTTLDAS
jgi:GDP-mannose 6-dehydrogenase